jgi:hypothetical protein
MVGKVLGKLLLLLTRLTIGPVLKLIIIFIEPIFHPGRFLN